jgi:hypothetical protein
MVNRLLTFTMAIQSVLSPQPWHTLLLYLGGVCGKMGAPQVCIRILYYLSQFTCHTSHKAWEQWNVASQAQLVNSFTHLPFLVIPNIVIVWWRVVILCQYKGFGTIAWCTNNNQWIPAASSLEQSQRQTFRWWIFIFVTHPLHFQWIQKFTRGDMCHTLQWMIDLNSTVLNLLVSPIFWILV